MPNIFVVDLLGTAISAEEKIILQHPNVGALLLFTRNFNDPAQLHNLIKSVKNIRADIFIAVDHEGGIVQRLQRHGFRCIPAARVYGDVYDLNAEVGIQLAEQYGEIMARDLLAYGINLSLAPVIDLHDVSNVIAKLDRAFHRDPDVVVTLAAAFIRGMHKAGMPAVGKHFPGHGSVPSDSHIAQPVSSASAEELRQTDLKPFLDLIAKNALAAVMPAHVKYTAIDPKHAAGFSKIWLNNILRDELKFEGLVLSDCLGMAGADIGNLHERARQALIAGCDMLIVCNQTRHLLQQLLETFNFEQPAESLQRITAFTNMMLRVDKAGRPEQKPLFTATELTAISANNGLNNTKCV
jgi:beta-N-acetylhexosaminidase